MFDLMRTPTRLGASALVASILALAGGVGAAKADPPGDSGWIEAAVQEALAWEVMPGTEGVPDDGTRARALRKFFRSNPEYRDPALRAKLAEDACGLEGTEAAHERRARPPRRAPVVVDASGAPYRVLVVHWDRHCTSDDWGYYSGEASEAARKLGALVAWANPDADAVLLRRADRELARVPLTGQGFLLLREGLPPQELGYSPEAAGDPDFARYLGAAGPELGAGALPPARRPFSLDEAQLAAHGELLPALLGLLGAPADGIGVPVSEEELRAVVRRLDPTLTYRDELVREATPPDPVGKRASASPVEVFLRPENLALARAFLTQHGPALAAAEARHGVSRHDLVAVLLWQSKLGRSIGAYRLVNLLLARALLLRVAYDEVLAAGRRDPQGAHRKRVDDAAARAARQVAAQLRFCKAQGVDPTTVVGSLGGGVGLAQYTPDAWRWLQDGDGDGRLRLDSTPDTLMSLAHQLETSGYRTSREQGLLGYNPGKAWAAGVMRVADVLAAERE